MYWKVYSKPKQIKVAGQHKKKKTKWAKKEKNSEILPQKQLIFVLLPRPKQQFCIINFFFYCLFVIIVSFIFAYAFKKQNWIEVAEYQFGNICYWNKRKLDKKIKEILN